MEKETKSLFEEQKERLAAVPRFKVAVKGSRVLVEPLPINEFAGPIILNPDTIKSDRLANTLGIVLQVGEPCWKDLGEAEPRCKEGDMVLFQRYGGARIHDPIANEFRPDMYLINDQDIQAVVDKEDYTRYKAAYKLVKEESRADMVSLSEYAH